MLTYNPKNWFTFIFRFHRSDTVRALFPLMLAIAVYAGILAYLELEFFKLSDNPYIKNITLMHTLLGFVISLLLVFRTNTAYERWWEGRKLWGSLVNNSRALAIKLHSMLPNNDKESRVFFSQTIANYAQALSIHLSPDAVKNSIDTNELPYSESIDTGKHIPNQITLLLTQRIQELYASGSISGEQLLFVNTELQTFTDVCGACERIKSTPIPFSYSVFLKKFVFFYVMTIPIGYVFAMGWLVIPVSVFILYVLASMELIAEEIEDPFGSDSNDLPTALIAKNIRKHVAEILE